MMPYIQIDMLEGRSHEQIKKNSERYYGSNGARCQCKS